MAVSSLLAVIWTIVSRHWEQLPTILADSKTWAELSYESLSHNRWDSPWHEYRYGQRALSDLWFCDLPNCQIAIHECGIFINQVAWLRISSRCLFKFARFLISCNYSPQKNSIQVIILQYKQCKNLTIIYNEDYEHFKFPTVEKGNF